LSRCQGQRQVDLPEAVALASSQMEFVSGQWSRLRKNSRGSHPRAPLAGLRADDHRAPAAGTLRPEDAGSFPGSKPACLELYWPLGSRLDLSPAYHVAPMTKPRIDLSPAYHVAPMTKPRIVGAGKGYFAEVLLRQQRHRRERIFLCSAHAVFTASSDSEAEPRRLHFSIAENCPVLDIFRDMTVPLYLQRGPKTVAGRREWILQSGAWRATEALNA
jgi:hypothetical protein